MPEAPGDPPDILAAKRALRETLKARRDALPEAARETAARAVLARLDGPEAVTLLPGPGGRIAFYWPFGSEFDPRPLAGALAARGHVLALPRVEGRSLRFHAFAFGEALANGPFGLREPPESAPLVVPDLLIVPLLGFDARRHRLGYGKGCYDRALAALPRALTIGLAFQAQQLPELPVGPHDRPLDAIWAVPT